MHLYIARHAWAGHFGDPGWDDDSLRELTPEGIERYRGVVAALTEQGFAPQRIATSPYARCRQTADLIAAGVAGDPPVEELEALEPGSQLGELLAWTEACSGENVCWVGHNPDVERLAAAMVVDEGAWFRFAKGSVAAIEFKKLPMRPGRGELLWHSTAKSLGL